MSSLKRFFWAMLIVSVALPVAGWVSAAPAPQPVADGPNLLVNPGFESPFVKQCCQTDLQTYLPNTPIDEVQVAAGWLGWWVDPNPAIGLPGSCDGWQGSGRCVAFHRPEWREANCGNADCAANRVRSGRNAQKYFTFYSIHDSGMYQRVTNVAPGQRLRFSVYMMGWATHENYGPSSGQTSMGMQVGIDPTGGTNPFSPNVVWGGVADTYDAWGLYTVEAVARSAAVTVFTRSRPVYPLQHNDIYIDDASLVVATGSSVVTSGGTKPTAAAVSGGATYVVKKGDNFYRLARRFGISFEALVAANPTVKVLQIGQTIILPGVTQAAADAGSSTGTTVSSTPVPGSQTTYVVQPGDSLARIARKYNTTIDRLRELNNLKTDVLQPGQVIVVGP